MGEYVVGAKHFHAFSRKRCFMFFPFWRRQGMNDFSIRRKMFFQVAKRGSFRRKECFLCKKKEQTFAGMKSMPTFAFAKRKKAFAAFEVMVSIWPVRLAARTRDENSPVGSSSSAQSVLCQDHAQCSTSPSCHYRLS